MKTADIISFINDELKTVTERQDAKPGDKEQEYLIGKRIAFEDVLKMISILERET